MLWWGWHNARLDQPAGQCTQLLHLALLSHWGRPRRRTHQRLPHRAARQVDFHTDDPIEMIKRLMIGSEGTLGFVSQVTYNTVPEWPHKASAFVVFPDVMSACQGASGAPPLQLRRVALGQAPRAPGALHFCLHATHPRLPCHAVRSAA